MRDRLIKIHLHGPLGEKFGELHRFAVMTPREAVHALDANYPGFIAAFADHPNYGIFVDDEWREGETGAVSPASQEIHFVPLSEGNVPVVALGLSAAFGLGATAATIIGSVLVLGLMIGVSFLFRPKKQEQKAAEKDESFIFTGPENVTGQGVAVPLVYGRVFCGSVVVSAGQETVDIITTTPAPGVPKPAAPSVAKPKNPATGTDYPPPNGRTSDRVARMSAFAVADDDPPPPMWPDTDNMGAGTDHLKEPPVEGWPPIVEDPVYIFRPDGWVLAKIIWLTEEDDLNRKQVLVWQPDYLTLDYVYNWNMVRGFYVTPVGVDAEEEELIAGYDMENPIQDPSP